MRACSGAESGAANAVRAVVTSGLVAVPIAGRPMLSAGEIKTLNLMESLDRRSGREGKDPRARIQRKEDMRARRRDAIQYSEYVNVYGLRLP